MPRNATINDQVLRKMAYTRGVFKDKLEAVLGGALGEFYKAECAKANGFTKWVEHWMGEADRLLLFAATQVYLHSIRGFKDRRKALVEALAELQRADSGYRNYATSTVTKDYAAKKLRQPIPADATARFYAWVEERIKAVEENPLLDME